MLTRERVIWQYIPADVLNWQRPVWPFSHPIQKELEYTKVCLYYPLLDLLQDCWLTAPSPCEFADGG